MPNYSVIHHSIGSVAHRTNAFACVVTFAAKRLAALRTIIHVFTFDFLSAFRTKHIFSPFYLFKTVGCKFYRRLTPPDAIHRVLTRISIIPTKSVFNRHHAIKAAFASIDRSLCVFNLTQSFKSSIDRFVIVSFAVFRSEEMPKRSTAKY